MKEVGVEANTVVYNSALDACGRAGKPKVAAKLLRKMGEAGKWRSAFRLKKSCFFFKPLFFFNASHLPQPMIQFVRFKLHRTFGVSRSRACVFYLVLGDDGGDARERKSRR